MRRRLAMLAAVSMFALALGATPVAAAGGPPTHTPVPATELNDQGPVCGYTFVSGQFFMVSRDPSTAAHGTAVNVVATKDGASYKVVGVETYNDLKGHLTIKMMFIAQGGGIADSLNVVLRYYPNLVDLRVAKENDSYHVYG